MSFKTLLYCELEEKIHTDMFLNKFKQINIVGTFYNILYVTIVYVSIIIYLHSTR